jgi:hypothetical protein
MKLTFEGYQAGGIYVADPDRKGIHNLANYGQGHAESSHSCV